MLGHSQQWSIVQVEWLDSGIMVDTHEYDGVFMVKAHWHSMVSIWGLEKEYKKGGFRQFGG